MKKQIPISVCALAVLFFLSSCSHRLVGTWNVKKYENSTPGQQEASVADIGTIRFKKNGTGSKNISYEMRGFRTYDNNNFHWEWTNGKYVSLIGVGSEFNKTWIIAENKKKYQKWQATDGANKVQTLILKKK